MPVSDSEDKPVVNGLVALVAVAVVVGLLAGIALMIGTKMLGVGGGDGGDGGPAAGESLVLPDPSRTTRQSDPLITLLPSDDDGAESDSASASNEPKATKKAKPKAEISLTQGAFRRLRARTSICPASIRRARAPCSMCRSGSTPAPGPTSRST